MSSSLRSYAMLALFVALMAGAAATGSQFRSGAWYMALVKPSWTPPGWLFAPVWTVLYVMIAIAGWLAWRAGGLARPTAFWLAQLVLNAAWSWAMFGRNHIGLALADIAMLWLAIGAFIWSAWPVSRAAALLFVPYWAWVSFSSALNFAIYRLTP